MFFVPFFLNSPRDRGYRLCIASWHSSVSGSCHLHGGHSAWCLLIHRDLLPFQTSAARGQCPGEHVCIASGPWGATDRSSRLAEFIDQLEMLRCFLPLCGVLCVDWLMPTCAQHVRLASLWVLEMYMPRVSYIRVERTGFIEVFLLSVSYIPRSVEACIVLLYGLFRLLFFMWCIHRPTKVPRLWSTLIVGLWNMTE